MENSSNDKIIGKKCGTVTVSVYKDCDSGYPFFYVKSDNQEMLPIADIIENSLKGY